ncbi:AMP-binding protein [Nocardiopsis mangrovi]|uniref:AMP-binding protein n=1 Tax=Nocardiopsis mangrovi TaxID=1179818 RepID=A0ABV9E0M5_9ACTN
MLRAQARARPDAVVVADADARLGLAALAGEAQRVARALIAAGLRPGDRVALLGPNSAQWAAIAFGVWDAGAVLVPLSSRFRGIEAADLLRRTGTRLLFTTEHFLDTSFVRLIAEAAGGPAADDGAPATGGPSAEDPTQDGRPFPGLPELHRVVLLDAAPGDPAAALPGVAALAAFTATGADVAPADAERRALAVSGDDLAEVLATSGTTGAPKGVLIHHAQLLRGYWDWSAVVGLREGDRYPVIAPFSHGFGVNAGLLAGVMRAALLLPQAVFSPERLLRLVERERVTVLAGPPTLFHGLLDGADAGHDLSSLRVGICGAASVPPELIRRLLGAGGRAGRTGGGRGGLVRRMINAYGLIEGTVVSMTRADDPVDVIAATAGRPMPGVEVRIVDEAGAVLPAGERGEILVGGYGVMRGYLGDPGGTGSAVDAASLLHTGDIGVLDAAGNLAVVDRKKDMFIVGGFNAYPAEIEALLLRHPGIAQAAVVPVPDPRLGEVGCAFVVARAGRRVSPSGLTAWAREHMSNYKVPRRVVVVDALPTGPTGKTDKPALRRRAATGG